MSEYAAVITWERKGETFTDGRYSRGHRWVFDGGVETPASASPHLVPAPFSVAAAVDPEEAFVASLSSCHMLWFLHVASNRGYLVDRYRDEAVGTLARDAQGRLAMTEVVLRPSVAFAGDRSPAPDEHEAMHEEAHDRCFIASSVKTELRCEPTRAPAPAARR